MLAKDRIRFFSHDVDMRNDLKIRGLRREFHNDGYAVWCYLLEVLTDTEELSIDIEEMNDLLAADFDITPERLRQIVDYCIKVGLFQREGNILYSTRHRERITGVVEKARVKSERGRKAVMARWNKTREDSNTDEQQDDTSVFTSNTDEYKEEKSREEEIRQEKEKKRVEYSCDAVVKLWNEVCTDLPKVMRLSDARRDKVKARLKEWGEGDREKMTDYARELFERIQASDFLTGRSGKWKGATFDWIFDSRNNWIKVMEGNYDNQRGSASRAPRGNNVLGVGEYMTADGRRTYGSGKAVIPQDAPPRPSERHTWNAANNQWVLL